MFARIKKYALIISHDFTLKDKITLLLGLLGIVLEIILFWEIF